MTEKELRKLSRVELLKLLLEQSKENQTLQEQLQTAEKALADKTLRIDQAGSIAEASLQLSGVFQAAEEACRQYTDNVKFTVVDCIGKENVEKSRKLAEKLGIPLRVREYTAE